MATIKSYTDISQSKTLSKILPLESADMIFVHTIDLAGNRHYDIGFRNENPLFEDDVPCWSLASLLEQLPYEVCDDDGKSLYLQINKEDDVYQLEYTGTYEGFGIETDRYEHFVDACVTMVEKLHELNLL